LILVAHIVIVVTVQFGITAVTAAGHNGRAHGNVFVFFIFIVIHTFDFVMHLKQRERESNA
jgi:hypothetical protein